MPSDTLLRARFEKANANLPGDPQFWAMMLDQSDNFAFKTARDGKGGPFGAQLWLVNPSTNDYVLVGTAKDREDSNAVVSKGLASAHAEAENLSLQKRQQVTEFLKQHEGKGWQVVQVSSGESCQGCRAKQVLFAQELVEKGLISKGDFHVVFKATFQQTKRDADFNDAPYDMAFRAINELGILDTEDGLYALHNILQADSISKGLIASGELIYNQVRPVQSENLKHKEAAERLSHASAENEPYAVIIDRDGKIIGEGHDMRTYDDSDINISEHTAIMLALHSAARLKREQGIFESWDLEGATLITNIKDIGPKDYAESLWFNLGHIEVVDDLSSAAIDEAAQELPGTPNRDLFRIVAAEYNQPDVPITATFIGNVKEANLAHAYWKIHIGREAMLAKQAERVKDLGSKVSIRTIGGEPLSVASIVEHSDISSHYDGKQAEDAPNVTDTI